MTIQLAEQPFVGTGPPLWRLALSVTLIAAEHQVVHHKRQPDHAIHDDCLGSYSGRCSNRRERERRTAAERAEGAPTGTKFCGVSARFQRIRDPSVTREPKSAIAWVVGGDFEFKNWSGAGDLNPGPHGPEPCRCRVLRCPTDSRVVLANTGSTGLVSFGDPLEPSGAGNA